ncbi:alpha/beta hydrolase [Betaproteobacteria bacterium]|nr:alpha/beta hydrolase [Betaproteobacteria bacterium]
MKGSYGSSRAYEIEISSGSENHKLHVNEWGFAKNPRTILCLHGVTQCSLDFSVLASFFSKSYRVVCPDLVGRGQSSWLENKFSYQLPFYVQDILLLFSELNLKDVRIIGTSLGGLLGMILASSPDKYIRALSSSEISKEIKSTWDPKIIKALVLNDVGALVNFGDLVKLNEETNICSNRYLTIADAEKNFKLAMESSLGPHSHSEWKLLASFYTRYDYERKCFKPHYDPAILNPYDLPELLYNFTKFGLESIPELNLYNFYDNISIPTLLLRGMNSQILGRKLADDMTKRGPKPKLVEFEGVGHAPTLIHLDQLRILEKFLEQN